MTDIVLAIPKRFSGPIGSGKSKALCMEAMRCAYLNPGVLGLIGAPTYRILADSTELELLGSLEEHHIPFRYHKSEKRITVIEPGSDIILRTLDEPERLRAMNLGWFGVDELTYCKKDAWLRLEGRDDVPRTQEPLRPQVDPAGLHPRRGRMERRRPR